MLIGLVSQIRWKVYQLLDKDLYVSMVAPKWYILLQIHQMSLTRSPVSFMNIQTP